MTEIFKTGIKVFGKLIIVVLICNFICLSTQMLSTSLFCDTVGYSVYGYEGEDEDDLHHLYDHYYNDGEDTRLTEYNESEYTLQRRSIRTEMSTPGKAVFLIVTQIICVIITISFLYKPLWSLGVRDSNSVKFKHIKEDKLKGFKIGLVASVPSLLFYIFFIFCGNSIAPNMPTVIYTWLNCHVFSLLTLIFDSFPTAGTLGVFQYLLLFILQFATPIFAAVCYLLGYKNIDIAEKVVYEKNEE